MFTSPLRGVLAATAALALTLGCASVANANTYTVADGATAENGGACTGTTCPSLRSAFDAANGNPGDDTVIVPAGHYILSKVLVVNQSNTAIVGAGIGKTII